MSTQTNGLPPFGCEMHLTETSGYVKRWSNAHIAPPKVVVVPNTEDDVVVALRYAQNHKLRVVVAGGGHAPFVPVSQETLYLDMRHFKSISLDKEASTVTVGGGVLVGELLPALTAQGFYTTLPYANSVGVVGSVMGGGNNPFNSLHGFVVDNVERAHIITASDGATHDISPSSSDGDERALFAALCGAGFGLGVVTSLTLRVYPLSALTLDEGDKVWQRRVIFQGAAVRDAARALLSLLPVRGPLAVALLYRRNPQTGAPIAVLVVHYFGPFAEAEKSDAARVLRAPEVTQKAVMAITAGVTVTEINALGKDAEARGGAKMLDSTFASSLDEDTIVALFENYVAFTDGRPDTWKSSASIAAWDTTKTIEMGSLKKKKGDFFQPRDRGLLLIQVSWSEKSEREEELKLHLADMRNIFLRGQSGPVMRFANNLSLPADLKEFYSADQIQELQKIKQRWDPTGLLWSPASGTV
ncbi:FAD binding domain protein [Niveomyces insectorum RCEF 264]|uniref:FAD binding domain protein n=1 Tax=Niveomyces insectorum RCEF 264 TaxID=1081102 RepID=A0A167MNW0_9HYPO|nr:FAD binding domain protein [Niveomyces insectorum RCEF 264]